jgi:hypothetical protein
MRAEVALRIAGTLVGLLLGFLTALWEIFASPLRAGAFPLPVSPLLAIATNVGLVWFTRRVTGKTGLALLPGVVWFGTMMVAASKTRAGDLLIPGNEHMGLAAILLGALAWGVGGYWVVLNGRPPAPTAPAPTAPAPAATAPARPAPPATGSPARKPAPGAKPVSTGRGRGRRPSAG